MKFAGDSQHLNTGKLVIIPAQRVAGNMYGREDAIKALQCVSPNALGCGRQITSQEILGWDRDTITEYRQSGWCNTCQDKIFTDQDECICEWIDVLVDPDYIDHDNRFNYDPDMREDDPPTDINEIKWTVNYAA